MFFIGEIPTLGCFEQLNKSIRFPPSVESTEYLKMGVNWRHKLTCSKYVRQRLQW